MDWRWRYCQKINNDFFPIKKLFDLKVADGGREVFMLQPFTSKDFAIRSLADRISDLPHLISLYPEIAKNTAFSKYYTPLIGKLLCFLLYSHTFFQSYFDCYLCI